MLRGLNGGDGGGRLGGFAGPVSGGYSSGPGGSGTVRVAEIGMAGAAGMAEAGNSTADSCPQVESSDRIMLPCADPINTTTVWKLRQNPTISIRKSHTVSIRPGVNKILFFHFRNISFALFMKL